MTTLGSALAPFPLQLCVTASEVRTCQALEDYFEPGENMREVIPLNELRQLTKEITEFRDARDWPPFHSPRNLAAALAQSRDKSLTPTE